MVVLVLCLVVVDSSTLSALNLVEAGWPSGSVTFFLFFLLVLDIRLYFLGSEHRILFLICPDG